MFLPPLSDSFFNEEGATAEKDYLSYTLLTSDANDPDNMLLLRPKRTKT